MFFETLTETRFWKKVQKAGPDDCWQWLGAQTSAKNKRTGVRLGPYGEVKINGKVKRAHRVAWLLTRGEIPAQTEVCHTCDNRLCCNPKHLFLGSHLENMRDMFSKGKGKHFFRRSVMLADDTELTQQIRLVLAKMQLEGSVSLSRSQREIFGKNDPRGGRHFRLIKSIWSEMKAKNTTAA